MKRTFIGLIFAVMCFGSLVFGFSSVSALTYSSDVPISFTFNSTIAVQLSSADIYITNLAPGASSDSNIITVGANTNASAGFQLSATVGVKNGTDALVNTNDNTYTFANISSNKATLANFSDNTWGYSYCANTAANCNGGSGTWVSGSVGSTTAGYNGLPLDDNTNANERGKGGVLLISTTGTEGEQKTVQFKIGAKASNAQASGAYTNTINFYAVANPEPELGPVACEAGVICYNENALSGVDGTMGQQSDDDNGNPIGSGSAVTLLASNFSRSGYGFAGWSTTYDYSDPSGFYGPNETIIMPNDILVNGLSLYAIWIPSVGSMQVDGGAVCNTLNPASTNRFSDLSSVSALTDARDNQTYAIAKLADGKCWMIENLRLESAYATKPNAALAQGYDNDFAGLATTENANFSTVSYPAENSLYSTNGANGTINIGMNNTPSARMPRYNNLNTQSRAIKPKSNVFPNDNTTGGIYGYGNYYTYAAAIANFYSWPGLNGNPYDTSICPNGWRIPTSGLANWSFTVNIDGRLDTFRDYYYLGYAIMGLTASQSSYNSGYSNYVSNNVNANGDNAYVAFRKFPNNFIFSGAFEDAHAVWRGFNGVYWGYSTQDETYAFGLGIFNNNNDNLVAPGTYADDKSHGEAIRCLINS